MSLGRLVVTAVTELGRPKAEVAREFGVSRRWVHELVGRYETEGWAGLEPRSRRPLRSPHRTSAELEDEIVELRKRLMDEGLDAGAHTIAFHLERRHGAAPAPSMIWRVLPGEASSPRNPRSARGARSSASKPTCPTSGGRPT